MRFSVQNSGFLRLAERWDGRRLRAAVAEVLGISGEEMVAAARRHLQPIYQDASRRSWEVTGALRRSIRVVVDGERLVLRLSSDLPYSRRRHFENRAHPPTAGFLSIPLFEEKDKLLAELGKIIYKK